MTQYNKVFVKNIYYMLAYSFKALSVYEIASLSAEEFDNPHNLFAAILNKGLGRQLKQGLHRDYLTRSEDLTTLRGRILMPDTMRNAVAHRPQVGCEFDELSENILLNQVLKTAATLLLRQGLVDEAHRQRLRKKLLFLDGVDLVNPAQIPWSAIRLTPATRSYRVLLGLSRFILEGVLAAEEDGGYTLYRFDPTSHEFAALYESFLVAFFTQECPELRVRAPHIPWALDDGYRHLLPTMKSDIVLEKEGRTLIIDAKFYGDGALDSTHHGSEKSRSAHLYQIFTYVKNAERTMKRGHEPIRGMLLYAATESGRQPDVTYQMSGNPITVTTLNLNQEFPAIKERLLQIAAEL